jgi:ABC-type uncharacterized transport system ATPase subunit
LATYMEKSGINGINAFPALQVEGLTKHFPEVLANDSISFDVRSGEIHCLLGENGAGKSTLAKCIYGAYQPDEGKICYKGEPVRIACPRDAIRLGIGMVHQHFVLIDSFTVIENIVLGTESSGTILDFSLAKSKINSLCATYSVDLDLDAKIRQLSVGEQQWVEILKALYIGAELLILDEPTAVLTPQEADRLFFTLKRMTAKGLSIIFITHKLREVMEVSNRITVLRKGRKVTTVDTFDVSKNALASMMVGRDVTLHITKEAISPGKPVLEVKNLWAQTDRGQEALRGITFSVHSAEILGIAGVAGNGQKELFEVLVGVRSAEQGEILLEGNDIAESTPKTIMEKGISHIPQDRIHEGLIPDFTVAENMVLGSQRSRRFRKGIFLDYRALRAFARERISSFDIATPSADQMTSLLSGGNLQKVILARELAQAPKCLIANQPTRGLDVGAIENVHMKLLGQRKAGVAILLFSEDLEEIFSLADRIAVIFKGQIVGLFDIQEAQLEEIGLLMAGVEASKSQ